MFKEWLHKFIEYILFFLKVGFGIAAVVLFSCGMAQLFVHNWRIGVIAMGALVILAIALSAYLEIKYH